MQLKNDERSGNVIRDTLISYFEKKKIDFRIIKNVLEDAEPWLPRRRVYALIDRRHVIRCSVGKDPTPSGEKWLSNIELAIGPFFFSPVDFLSHDKSKEFGMSADVDTIKQNIELLGEYLNIS